MCVIVVIVSLVAGKPAPSPSMRLCRSTLGDAVVAASPTTVGDIRNWDTGMAPPNDANRHPFENAWPSVPSTEFAALCTTGSSTLYTFHAVGPDGAEVQLEQVRGIQGPPPAVPPPHA